MTPHEVLVIVIVACAVAVAGVARLAYLRWWPRYDDEPTQEWPMTTLGMVGMMVADFWAHASDEWEPAPTDRIAVWARPAPRAIDMPRPQPAYAGSGAGPGQPEWGIEENCWDARIAAERCWEIRYVDFPRLRHELGLAS